MVTAVVSVTTTTTAAHVAGAIAVPARLDTVPPRHGRSACSSSTTFSRYAGASPPFFGPFSTSGAPLAVAVAACTRRGRALPRLTSVLITADSSSFYILAFARCPPRSSPSSGARTRALSPCVLPTSASYPTAAAAVVRRAAELLLMRLSPLIVG